MELEVHWAGQASKPVADAISSVGALTENPVVNASTCILTSGSARPLRVNGSQPSNAPASSRCWSLGFPTAPSRW